MRYSLRANQPFRRGLNKGMAGLLLGAALLALGFGLLRFGARSATE